MTSCRCAGIAMACSAATISPFPVYSVSEIKNKVLAASCRLNTSETHHILLPIADFGVDQMTQKPVHWLVVVKHLEKGDQPGQLSRLEHFAWNETNEIQYNSIRCSLRWLNKPQVATKRIQNYCLLSDNRSRLQFYNVCISYKFQQRVAFAENRQAGTVLERSSPFYFWNVFVGKKKVRRKIRQFKMRKEKWLASGALMEWSESSSRAFAFNQAIATELRFAIAFPRTFK